MNEIMRNNDRAKTESYLNEANRDRSIPCGLIDTPKGALSGV